MKRCTTCTQEKPLEAFYVRRGKPVAACKECSKARVKIYTTAHRGERITYLREYYHENKPRLAAADRERAARNRVARNTYRRRWAKENPGAEREIRRRRYARKKQATVEFVDSLVVLEMDDGVCGICGEDVDPFAYELDHVVPLKRGGEHSYANTQVAHPYCNRSKGSRPLEAA